MVPFAWNPSAGKGVKDGCLSLLASQPNLEASSLKSQAEVVTDQDKARDGSQHLRDEGLPNL